MTCEPYRYQRLPGELITFYTLKKSVLKILHTTIWNVIVQVTWHPAYCTPLNIHYVHSKNVTIIFFPQSCLSKLMWNLRSIISKLRGTAKGFVWKSFSHRRLWSSWLMNSGLFPLRRRKKNCLINFWQKIQWYNRKSYSSYYNEAKLTLIHVNERWEV